MNYLSVEDIRNADDIKTEDVEIPEWGGKVAVKGMSGRLRSNLEQKIAANAPSGDIKMLIVLECTVNEDGSRMFTNSDRKWLVEKAAGPIESIFEAVCKLSGVAEGAVEEAEGN